MLQTYEKTALDYSTKLGKQITIKHVDFTILQHPYMHMYIHKTHSVLFLNITYIQNIKYKYHTFTQVKYFVVQKSIQNLFMKWQK